MAEDPTAVAPPVAAPPEVAGGSDPTSPQVDPVAEQKRKDINQHLTSQIAASKRQRKIRMPVWERNVWQRLGMPDGMITGGVVGLQDEVQNTLNPDWSLTKTKTANLYSQVPSVQGTHENKQYAAAVAPFMKALNYELGEKRANVGVSMEEVLNDTVNAAGVGAHVVSYTARFRMKKVPAIDTSQFQLSPDEINKAMEVNAIPSTTVPETVSSKFSVTRISPKDLLWPVKFRGSNFDDGPWIGYTGRMTWAEAKNTFKLQDSQKELVLGNNTDHTEDYLAANREISEDAPMVEHDTIYYWRALVDPDELQLKSIWRLVKIKGIDEPLNEPWKGQQLDAQTNTYVGACRFPVRVLTLTYITDNPIPPSDSEAGRPQVLDMQRSRSQMFMNRDRSRPIRWFDANRVDPLIRDNLLRGTWQAMIPTNGDGSRVVGEIARASYPSEDFSFDRAAKEDLMEAWQVGPNQLGSLGGGEKSTAAEVKVTQGNFATRIGQERGRVASFFLQTAEVLAGLMALYGDFPTLTPDERKVMDEAWDRKHILHDLVLSIRPDSTVLLDTQSRIQRLMDVLNMLAKSGLIDPTPIIREILELSGLDPTEIIKPPAQPHPEKPKISITFSGKDDVTNPMTLALLESNGMPMPSPQDLAMAKNLLQSMIGVPIPAAPQPGMPGAPPPGPPQPPRSPLLIDQHPSWQLMPKVASRSRDLQG